MKKVEQMTTDARKRANAKYDAANTKRITVKLNFNTDADILTWLEQHDKAQTAIKAAIREQIKRETTKSTISPRP